MIDMNKYGKVIEEIQVKEDVYMYVRQKPEPDGRYYLSWGVKHLNMEVRIKLGPWKTYNGAIRASKDYARLMWKDTTI